MKTLEAYFEFFKLKTTWRQEAIAGLTTSLTMAYIIFVNPSILAEVPSFSLPALSSKPRSAGRRCANALASLAMTPIVFREGVDVWRGCRCGCAH